ncbi:pyruvate kinase [Paenibacillus alvei]|uniref:Pyruvate kinase n=1 Tax=Paenibacillus alvei TaxID=44250 RepID=A0AAP7DK70_PAEAL|nr:hypothetical protein [Paenibacillus alvei]EJW20339.1 hypothetical protein PAV_1c13430 [Paenibacillus alvei DSM 29]MCY7488148.1 pyruvate kinase [Paenibacillus alvei]MCY9540266.1 pyruvate kinase [Paenibacillus alvei]MCY9705790.1 pyruvate kinase [Paenibacillus alvei]MCY9738296.1 pyruvate kinase [Paenibacillus alvei]
MRPDILTLYEKFLLLSIPNPFTLSDIDTRLKTKYFAEEVDLDQFEGLKKDPYAHYESIVKAYTFRDERGFNQLEKLNPSEYLSSEEINLLINSDDNIYMSGGTTQGTSFLLALETNIFGGIKKESMVLGNEEFEDYLKALYLTGYIDLEDDFLLQKAHERYRKGNVLKYFGYTQGESTF